MPDNIRFIASGYQALIKAGEIACKWRNERQSREGHSLGIRNGLLGNISRKPDWQATLSPDIDPVRVGAGQRKAIALTRDQILAVGLDARILGGPGVESKLVGQDDWLVHFEGHLSNNPGGVLF